MRKLDRFIFGLITLTFIISCSPTLVINDTNAKIGTKEVNDNSERQLHDIALNGKIYSALWQQNAGEFKALCYQAYNLATNIVTQKTSMNHFRPIAIITDIDETIIDNSPYAVAQAMKGKEFDGDTWTEWVNKAEAIAYPGAVDFFNYAASKNVQVFYITNRNEREKEATIENLRKLGFPYADEEHVIVKSDVSNKEARRQAIMQDYEVFMYLGDNLIDFAEVFSNTTQQERNDLVDEMSDYFGRNFIVLPNSGYGDWESALPGFKFSLPVEEKDQAILNNTKGY